MSVCQRVWTKCLFVNVNVNEICSETTKDQDTAQGETSNCTSTFGYRSKITVIYPFILKLPAKLDV
jgi:hypothetical protein